MLLSSILLGVAMALLIIVVAYLFEGGIEYGVLTANHVVGGIFIGVLIWAINYFGSDKVIAIIGIVLLALLAAVTIYYGCTEATRWYEVALVSGIFIILWITALNIIPTLTSWNLWATIAPTIVIIVLLAVMWIEYFVYHYEGKHLIEPMICSGYLIGAIATAVVAIILIICLAVGAIKINAAIGNERESSGDKKSIVVIDDDEDGGKVIEDDTTDWYHFFNSDLQEDKDKDNDFNFGPDPTNKDWTAKKYDKEFRRWLKLDPALTAADTAWLDAVVGTRYLGEFYESCKGDWAKTMNLAKERFMTDQLAYYKNLDAFFAFLDSAVKVEVRECKSVSDQMYMNPYTPDGVPDIIVMLTDDHSGYELVYTFKIKDNTFEVAYRINCGYQPTDVAEKMHITPQPKPEPEPEEPTTKPEEPTTKPEEPTTKPEEPTTKPEEPTTEEPTEPETTYNKDPEKATYEDLEPNDDPGPGEDTNNPKDPQHSKKDEPKNSDHYKDYDEYKDAIKDLEDINDKQKQGGDSNDPSTPKPDPNANVDNNGDKGTGNGGIDEPTPTQPPAKTEDGKEIVTEPAGSWGGPTD